MNNTILENRWKEVDKLLSTFYSKNSKLNRKLYKELQIRFNSLKITNLYDYATNKDIAKLKVDIEEIIDDLEGYIGYEIKKYSKRTKIKYIDLIRTIILVEYYKIYLKQKKEESTLFKNVLKIGYSTGQEEAIKELDKEQVRLLTVPEAFLLQLLGTNSFNGYKWYDYRDGVIKYNAEETYKYVIEVIRANQELDVYDDSFQKVFKKQEKGYLAKKDLKDSEDYQDEFYGSLDSEVATMMNNSVLEGMYKQGIKKVRFIAVIDDKTTDMCQSLDGQIFSIDNWNDFYRYSAEDGKEIRYHIKGLELGVNLPPITNHFHYCRSTIYPVR